MTDTEQTTEATAGNKTGEEKSANGARTTELTLRAGKADDAEGCGSICYEAFEAIAGQHNFPPDFPSSEVAAGLLASLLSRGDVYSVVAKPTDEWSVATSCGRTAPSPVSALSLLTRPHKTPRSVEG